jgi:hypothetical protein
MTSNDTNSNKQTVMLAVDAGSYSITTVHLAVEMAASMQTRILGLFIEDEDLLQVTGLPCTREITLTTARVRPISIDQMQRSFRSVALQFKQALQLQAQASQIAWSFDTVRGRTRDISLVSAADSTYIILGQSVSHRLQSRQSHNTRRILLVTNHSSYQRRALEAVLSRYRHEKIELTLVSEDREAEWVSALTRQANSQTNEIRLVKFRADQLPELLAETGYRFDCAILSKHEDSEKILRILKNLSCPVILVA